ncbi:MAG: hypothetical protein QNK37_30160 [Acidobacteriota bacterium]|nr:hypothetical protein [Acidobacteriota bacterium]
MRIALSLSPPLRRAVRVTVASPLPPGYMAPEQQPGGPNEPATGTDVYGLGVMFYDLFTDRSPKPGHSTRGSGLRWEESLKR